MNVFNEWNQVKQIIDSESFRDFYIKEREIWFVKMGKNIGFEEDGKIAFERPVLVIKKLGVLFLTVAMTTKGKSNHPFYWKLGKVLWTQGSQIQGKKSSLILSQIKVMDKRRFQNKLGTVDSQEFQLIKEKLKTFLF